MVHRNISRAPKHLYSAQKCFDTAKYILEVPQNIYMSAQIVICLRRYSWACTQTFWLAQKYFRLRRSIFGCAEIFLVAWKYFGLRGNILACAEILLGCAQTKSLRAEIIMSQPF